MMKQTMLAVLCALQVSTAAVEDSRPTSFRTYAHQIRLNEDEAEKIFNLQGPEAAIDFHMGPRLSFCRKVTTEN